MVSSSPEEDHKPVLGRRPAGMRRTGQCLTTTSACFNTLQAKHQVVRVGSAPCLAGLPTINASGKDLEIARVSMPCSRRSGRYTEIKLGHLPYSRKRS